MKEINALLPPTIFDDLQGLIDHLDSLKAEASWANVGIFFDEGNSTTLFLLIDEGKIKYALMLNLPDGLSIRAVQAMNISGYQVALRSYQGYNFTLDDISSIEKIQGLWDTPHLPTQQVDNTGLDAFFKDYESPHKKTGRGDNFSTDTINAVWYEAHGRCMFEGCGENLRLDELTGAKGNFAYLAHNVASSQNGPRGILYLSEALSNEPSNILLLCDKHHRLVDRVAKALYPAPRLTKMRGNFCAAANKLLDGLKFQPVPCFAVIWPVQRIQVSAPNERQIAQCLHPMQLRLLENLNVLTNNESIHIDFEQSNISALLPRIIEDAANKIIQQSSTIHHKAGLFAIGLMPMLIGLGAKIGNKNEIYPQLRFRDSGEWTWPNEAPNYETYDITGIEALTDNEEELVLALELTAIPNQFKLFSEEKMAQGIKTISITAKQEFMGNEAIGHPKEGIRFTTEMQKLLHHLLTNHGVKTIHLLPCASNAACVFFGKAFDSWHPNVIVYDFNEKQMTPSLEICNIENKCVLGSPRLN